MQKNKIFYLIFIMLIGCSFGGYNAKKDFNSRDGEFVDMNTYGIVILKLESFEMRAINSRDNILTYNKQPIAQTKWCNENNDCFYTNPYNGNSFVTGSLNIFSVVLGAIVGQASFMGYYDNYYKTFPEDYIVLNIKPGEYYLDYLELKNGEKESPKKILNFTLNASEVIYIGDISARKCQKRFSQKTYFADVQDTFPEAISYVKEKFSSIDPDSIKKYLMEVGTEAKEDKCKI